MIESLIIATMLVYVIGQITLINKRITYINHKITEVCQKVEPVYDLLNEGLNEGLK